MKDRIKQIQTLANMSQQEFAKVIGVAPGSLSSVYSERIQPTSNYVVGIHKAFPNININWLMFGEGDMYVHPEAAESSSPISLSDNEQANTASANATHSHTESSQASLFDAPSSAASDVLPFQNLRKSPECHPAVSHSRAQAVVNHIDAAKNFDFKQRQVKEIRVFFDDGTYETFVPSK